VSLGDAYRKIHNGSEAYKAYKEALDKNSNYAPAHHRIGEIFLTQKNPEVYLPYFNSAIEADAHYAPSLYQLYVYEFYHNPAKAMEYYNRYVSNADASLQHEYDLADLLYLNKQYDQAIAKATQIIAAQSLETQPRLYKLIGYSYAEKKDSLKALDYLQQYFARAPDSIIIGKDYETISALLMQSGNDSLATVFMVKAVEKEKDATVLFNYYKKLANIARQNKNYTEQAKWMSRYYTNNPKATNVDLYYWGLAHYLAGDYTQADTVFGLYVEKYPEQTFGYYWQAKSKALQDKEMTTGYAVPAYQKLAEVLSGNKDDANYKKWMVEAYGYLAAYEANTQKDYAEARELFEKVLEVDSENEDAKKYIAILDKQLNK
jgi:tetratricopeptide (TPR) repeat protein